MDEHTASAEDVVSYRLGEVEKKLDLVLNKVNGVPLLEYRILNLEKSRTHMYSFISIISLGLIAFFLERLLT